MLSWKKTLLVEDVLELSEDQLIVAAEMIVPLTPPQVVGRKFLVPLTHPQTVRRIYGLARDIHEGLPLCLFYYIAVIILFRNSHTSTNIDSINMCT